MAGELRLFELSQLENREMKIELHSSIYNFNIPFMSLFFYVATISKFAEVGSTSHF